jgi:hypothetical protein
MSHSKVIRSKITKLAQQQTHRQEQNEHHEEHSRVERMQGRGGYGYLVLECEGHGCLESEHEMGGLQVAVCEVSCELEGPGHVSSCLTVM